MSVIKITNARVHNLKNVSLEIPKNKLVVITGLSGSGKSSLAFDTIYAEGQRRYAESLSAYARQFMDARDRPDVDEIQGLSPTIAIDQKTINQNPRSTVGTSTEIYDHLRLLFARLGKQYCSDCHAPASHFSAGEIAELIRKAAREEDVIITAEMESKQGWRQLADQLETSDYKQIFLDGKVTGMDKKFFEENEKEKIEIVIGVVNNIKKQDIRKMTDQALELGNGSLFLRKKKGDQKTVLSLYPVCEKCGKSFPAVEISSFSFNSPFGACPRCSGLGITLEVDAELIIPNPRLTIAEGAIQPWTRIVGNQNLYQKILKEVAKKHNFSLDEPISNLSKKTMDIILYGTDGEQYEVEGKKIVFEGVVPNLLNRHSSTDSDYVRREIEQYMTEKTCPICEGKRLKTESLNVKIGPYSIADMVRMDVSDILEAIKTQENKKKFGDYVWDKKELPIAEPILKEMEKRLNNLAQVGLYYLTLDRSMNALSGGEAQRVRLSTQLSTGLTGVIYVLDEPSIGLHPKDNEKLIKTLKNLRDLGNTVIVVEHDASIMQAADHIVDVGPGAGEYGGEIIAEGTIEKIKKDKNSLTGRYLSGKEIIPVKKKYRVGNGKNLKIIGAKTFNLKNINVSFPLGCLICVTGVSGSGKSTLINHILAKAASKLFYRAKAEPGEYKQIIGLDQLDKVILVDQTPIGRTPRSNPATYTGVFTAIRDLFTNVPEARMRGLSAGSFSFNVKGGGRCEACGGEGYVRIPMQFMTDVFVECQECGGLRYNKEALEIHYRNKNIAEVLNMTTEEGQKFFHDTSAISEKLQILRQVGLGYIKLGQPATTLSGGEAQRVKLATELSRRSTGRTLYILDEPTTGLHFDDIKRLTDVLEQLVDKGNTVLIIEHNLDVIKSADWIIDMGPEGGKKGGEIIAEGPPMTIAKNAKSHTGQYLKKILEPKT